MHPLQIYLHELNDIRSTGAAVKETSYYPPLAKSVARTGCDGALGHRQALTLAELTEVMHMARRIAALLLLRPALDANYQAVKAASYFWPKKPKP